MALADASAFLAPPAAEMSADAPPNMATQQRLIALAAGYLNQAIPKLPNFVATRTTVHFEENARFYPGSTIVDYEPLHVAETSKGTVIYRNGREVADASESLRRRQKATDPYLTTYGTFGPALGLRWGLSMMRLRSRTT
jgi:hypothetical protein